MPECFKSGGFFSSNILWALNHETRHGERDGDLMTADRQDRGGGTVSPISSLCGMLLSDNRSCTTPDLSHVLLVAWRTTQDNGDVFSCVHAFVWGEGEPTRWHLWLGTFCAHPPKWNICLLFGFISFSCLSWVCVCGCVHVHVPLLHSQSMKACAGLEERCCVPVSGCAGSGSRLFITLRP